MRTNPSGAMVYVDRQPIGNTPVSVPFTYYGTRNVEVIRDGYRTEKILRTISPPWYQIPPLDFFSEVIWPFELRDERVIDITMVPEPVVTSQELMTRAEELRQQAGQGMATALPPPALTTTPPLPVLPQNGTGALPPQLSTPPPGLPGMGVPGISPPSMSTPGMVAPGMVAPGVMPQGATVMPPSGNGLPAWQPGQLLQEFFVPGGQPPRSIPNVGIPGAGFRPEFDPFAPPPGEAPRSVEGGTVPSTNPPGTK